MKSCPQTPEHASLLRSSSLNASHPWRVVHFLMKKFCCGVLPPSQKCCPISFQRLRNAHLWRFVLADGILALSKTGIDEKWKRMKHFFHVRFFPNTRWVWPTKRIAQDAEYSETSGSTFPPACPISRPGRRVQFHSNHSGTYH